MSKQMINSKVMGQLQIKASARGDRSRGNSPATLELVPDAERSAVREVGPGARASTPSLRDTPEKQPRKTRALDATRPRKCSPDPEWSANETHPPTTVGAATRKRPGNTGEACHLENAPCVLTRRLQTLLPVRLKKDTPGDGTHVLDLGSLARGANDAHDRLVAKAHQTALEALEAGSILMEVKAAVGHGRFQEWVRDNLSFSYETASLYMKVARRFAELQAKDPANLQSLAGLTFAQVARLVAKPRANNRPAATSGESNGTVDARGTEPGKGSQPRSHGPGTEPQDRKDSRVDSPEIEPEDGSPCQSDGCGTDLPDRPAHQPNPSAPLPVSASGPNCDIPRPPARVPIRWPGAETPQDTEDLEIVRGHFCDALVEIRWRYRNTPEELGRARKLWSSSKEYRERMIALLELKSPQAMAECEKCAGKGAAASGGPCGSCRGTGVMIVE